MGDGRDSARATGRRPHGRQRPASRRQLQAAGAPLQAAERVAVRSGLVGGQNHQTGVAGDADRLGTRAPWRRRAEGGGTASSVHSTSVAPARLTLLWGSGYHAAADLCVEWHSIRMEVLEVREAHARKRAHWGEDPTERR